MFLVIVMGREAGTAQGCVPDAHGLDHHCPCGQGCWQSSDLGRRLAITATQTVQFLPFAGTELECQVLCMFR